MRTAFQLAGFLCLVACQLAMAEGAVPNVAWQKQFQNAVKWSLLGVKADGVSDNTGALNALPTTKPIIADCPAGAPISYAGVWKWKSDLVLWQQPDCVLESTLRGTGTYAISQEDLNRPLTNVKVYGLSIRKDAARSTERIMRLWVDHFKLLHWKVGANGGFAFLRGSDQEIAYGVQRDTVAEVGNPGIRHIGNTPLVPNSPGMRANLWMHDNDILAGDSCYQVGQPLNTSLWTNVSTEHVLIENNRGMSMGSTLFLVGLDVNVPAFSDFHVSDVTIKDNSGGGMAGIAIFDASYPPNRVSDVRMIGGNFDESIHGTNAASFRFRTPTGGTVERVSIERIAVQHPNKSVMTLEGTGPIRKVSVAGSIFGAPRQGGFPTFDVENATDFSMVGNQISGGPGGDVLLFGGHIPAGLQAVARIEVKENTIEGVGSNRSGIRLVNVDSAEIVGNVIKAGQGAKNPLGVTLTAGAQGGSRRVHVTRNRFPEWTPTPRIACAPGAQNVVEFNEGAEDCAR